MALPEPTGPGPMFLLPRLLEQSAVPAGRSRCDPARRTAPPRVPGGRAIRINRAGDPRGGQPKALDCGLPHSADVKPGQRKTSCCSTDGQKLSFNVRATATIPAQHYQAGATGNTLRWTPSISNRIQRELDETDQRLQDLSARPAEQFLMLDRPVDADCRAPLLRPVFSQRYEGAQPPSAGFLLHPTARPDSNPRRLAK